MTDEEPAALRYAVASSEAAIDSSRTQHPAYVGPHLLVIADGTRHMSSPGSASAIAVERLRRLDTPTAASDMTASLEGGIGGIRETFAELLAANRGWDMTLAMVTARLWRGTHAAIARIGSTGAYLLRGGDLRRLPRSHTLGSVLLEGVAIQPDELGSDRWHTDILVRWLDWKPGEPADIMLHEAEPRDRYRLSTNADRIGT